jgi:hypothetical protein
MIYWSLSNVMFSSNCLHIFYFFCCCWVLVLMHCDQIECRGLFLFSYICWGLLCAIRYDQFWRKFHGLLRKMYIEWKLDKIFCRHQLGLFDLWCDLVLEFLYWFFCLDDLCICDRGVIKFTTTTVLESICAFKSFSVHFMKLGALILSAYRLIIVISFWCIFPIISMKCPSLSHLINVRLKSNLSNLSIATPTCFQGPLAW